MSTEQQYLRDVFALLLKRGREAKAAASGAGHGGDANTDFDAGRVQGYYEALSTMLHQLDAFGIDRASLGLPEDLKLERELL